MVLSKAKDTSISIASDVLKTVQSVERRVEEQQSAEKANESSAPEKTEAPVALILDPSKGSTKGTAEVVLGSRVVVPVKTEVTDRPASHPVVVSVGTPQTEASTLKMEELETSKSDETEQKADGDTEKEPTDSQADTPTK